MACPDGVLHPLAHSDGGGYSYRLCPFEANLTEECFQKTHLDFVHNEQAIVDRHNKLFPINVRVLPRSFAAKFVPRLLLTLDVETPALRSCELRRPVA